jgi:hypothetical protein
VKRVNKLLQPTPLPFTGAEVSKEEEEEEGWILNQRQLSALRRSEKVIHALGDESLQKLLLEIDSADDRQKALAAAINSDPRFAQFADTILSAIGVND